VNPSSIALSLSVLFLAANSALGQYIVSVDYVLCVSQMDGSANRREKVASISVVAIPDKKFHAKAVMGKQTFLISGIVKPDDQGHVLLDVESRWSKDTPIGRSTRRVSPGIQFDRMLIHAENLDAADQLAAEVEKQRIRLENDTARSGDDEVWYRWLGDTFVIGGLVQNRVSDGKREQLRSYYYFRLKETPK